MPHAARLILASASPRRQNLLREAGFHFLIHPADIDESAYPADFTASQIAQYLATAKAIAISQKYPGDVTLGSDTIVALGNNLLGKPTDAADARQMLSRLFGTTHQVISGVCVIHPAAQLRQSIVVTSTVHMRTLSPAEVDAYVAGRQWEGKAGGYGIQDQDPFVTRMDGSITNIVGLPMDETIALLATAGISPQAAPIR
jgi:septum formation protein